MADQTTVLDRRTLVGAITTFLAGSDRQTLDDIKRTLERAIDEAGPDGMARLNERLAAAGTDWTYFPPDPLAKRIHHLIAARLLESTSALFGIDNVASVADKRVVIVSNHLSYSDANMLEILLQRSGGEAFAGRLTVIAGPKVYSSLKRRFSSLCFGTIKTPQSSARSSEDAVMSAREVARAARQSIDIAHERVRAGDALLVFGEGARSRTFGMQPMLAGVTRYLEPDGVVILPVSIIGTEAMFPIGEETIHPVRIVVRVGRPLDAGMLRLATSGDRQLMMEVIGLAIAGLLPADYRGAYDDTGTDLSDAHRVMRMLPGQA